MLAPAWSSPTSSVLNVNFEKTDQYDFYKFYDEYQSLYKSEETRK